MAKHHPLVNDTLADVRHVWQLVHDVEHDLFGDRAQAACSALAGHRFTDDRPHGLGREPQADLLEFEELLVLLDERVLRLPEDLVQGVFAERLERYRYGKASHELGDQAELDEVFRGHMGDQAVVVRVAVPRLDLSAEPDGLPRLSPLDDLFDPDERAEDCRVLYRQQRQRDD